MPLPLLPLLLGGASFAGGLMGGGRKKVTSTTTPHLDPAFAGLQNIILPNIINRLQRPSALPEGLAERNTADINKVYQGAETGLENQLSARGLNTSPIAGNAFRTLQSNRAGDISRMRQSLPILEEDMRRQDLMDALAALGLGRGSRTVEEGGGGGKLGGGVSSLATMLGFLYGTGAFQQNPAAGIGTRLPFYGTGF